MWTFAPGHEDAGFESTPHPEYLWKLWKGVINTAFALKKEEKKKNMSDIRFLNEDKNIIYIPEGICLYVTSVCKGTMTTVWGKDERKLMWTTSLGDFRYSLAQMPIG